MNTSNYLQQMFQLALEGDLQGIWFWAAIYAALVCGYSLWFQIRTRTWPSTAGQLNQLGIRKFGATAWARVNQDYASNALYSYAVAGKTYEGRRISPWIFVVSHNARFVLEKQNAGIQHSPDGKVKVYYNPARPQKSYLIVAGMVGMLVTLLLGVLPLVTYLLKYHG